MNLVLLFTYGMSLDVWRRQGLLDRELAYYRKLKACGIGDVTLVTYGAADRQPESDVAPFHVAARPWFLGRALYSLLAPLLRRDVFGAAAIVKSNQSRGAWMGIVARAINPACRFIVRCGWVRTRETMQHDGLGRLRILWAETVEWLTFSAADAIFVTSASDKQYVASRYGIAGERIHVMPNVVDTRQFAPRPQPRRSDRRLRVLLVGRFVEMKNFQGVIRAAAAFGGRIEIVLVGDGPYRADLERLAVEAHVPVTFRSFLPNSAIPDELAAADLFIMPQLYGSGMSKVLLEAMACGTLAMASDIRPHREVVQDGVNGVLCGLDPDAIRAAIERVLVLTDEERSRMVARARQDVLDHYSMDALASREVAIYRSMLSVPGAPARRAS